MSLIISNCRICNNVTSNDKGVCVRCLDMLDNGFWPKTISPIERGCLIRNGVYVGPYIDHALPYKVDWEYNPTAANKCKDNLYKGTL